MSGLLRTLGAATLAAGVVGLVRQRREAVAVRRGELVAAWAAADLPPRGREDPVSARLARWVPEPPRTPVGRTAAALWASPLSVLGGLLVVVAARRWHWDTQRRCVVATDVAGPSSLMLRLVGADANTVGHVVLCRTPTPSATLLDHEAVHVRQSERLGPLLLAVYVWLGAVYGYRDHPLERAARLGARRSRPTGTRPAAR